MPFNPPPGWPPVPPGWAPPQGWQPDPSWGPPPPGWPLWLPDAAPPSTRRRGPVVWVVAGLVLVLVVAGGVFGYDAWVHRDEDQYTYQGGEIAAPAAPGTAQRVGGLTVTATAVDLSAASEVESRTEATGAGYTPPIFGDQALITFEVTNEGTADVPLLNAFMPYVVGTDGREFRIDTCTISLPDSLKTPRLAPGGSATGSYCIEVEPSDLRDATVVVRDGLVGVGVSWSTGG